MLPAQNRMTRSTEFGATVSRGTRAAQPDLVVYCLRSDQTEEAGPRVGLVVSKAYLGVVVFENGQGLMFFTLALKVDTAS